MVLKWWHFCPPKWFVQFFVRRIVLAVWLPETAIVDLRIRWHEGDVHIWISSMVSHKARSWVPFCSPSIPVLSVRKYPHMFIRNTAMLMTHSHWCPTRLSPESPSVLPLYLFSQWGNILTCLFITRLYWWHMTHAIPCFTILTKVCKWRNPTR